MQTIRELWDDLRRHDSVLWRRAMEWGVVHGPDALVRHGPAFFGLGSAALLSRQREAVRRNLRLAVGPRDPVREALDVAEVFTNFAGSLTDTFMVGSHRGPQLRVHCPDEGHLVRLINEGRGIILATAHTGGFQVATASLEALHHVPVLVVMGRERDARARALQDAARVRAGVRVVHVGDDPMDALTLLGHLRRRGVVALQMDRLPQGMRGRKARLFGVPFSVPEGPLRLAAVSGAPIVPVFTRRLGTLAYDVRVGEPIRLPRHPSEVDLDASARAVLSAMESFVRANPTQWFHFE